MFPSPVTWFRSRKSRLMPQRRKKRSGKRQRLWRFEQLESRTQPAGGLSLELAVICDDSCGEQALVGSVVPANAMNPDAAHNGVVDGAELPARVAVNPSGEPILSPGGAASNERRKDPAVEGERVCMKFPWQMESEGDSSCWLRVAQPAAGKQWGFMFWPRIGQEVIVTFVGSDPEQPLVAGHLAPPNQQLEVEDDETHWFTLLACVNGEHIPEATLELCRAAGEPNQAYPQYKFTEVFITSVGQPSANPSAFETDAVIHFRWQGLVWTAPQVQEVMIEADHGIGFVPTSPGLMADQQPWGRLPNQFVVDPATGKVTFLNQESFSLDLRPAANPAFNTPSDGATIPLRWFPALGSGRASGLFTTVVDKFEIYDYPGEYAQRFDGASPGGADSGPAPQFCVQYRATAFNFAGRLMEEEGAASLWIDVGAPVLQSADGQSHKPLFAFFVEDQGGYVNLNVHGDLLAVVHKPVDLAPPRPLGAGPVSPVVGGAAIESRRLAASR